MANKMTYHSGVIPTSVMKFAYGTWMGKHADMSDDVLLFRWDDFCFSFLSDAEKLSTFLEPKVETTLRLKDSNRNDLAILLFHVDELDGNLAILANAGVKVMVELISGEAKWKVAARKSFRPLKPVVRNICLELEIMKRIPLQVMDINVQGGSFDIFVDVLVDNFIRTDYPEAKGTVNLSDDEARAIVQYVLLTKYDVISKERVDDLTYDVAPGHMEYMKEIQGRVKSAFAKLQDAYISIATDAIELSRMVYYMDYIADSGDVDLEKGVDIDYCVNNCGYKRGTDFDDWVTDYVYSLDDDEARDFLENHLKLSPGDVSSDVNLQFYGSFEIPKALMSVAHRINPDIIVN